MSLTVLKFCCRQQFLKKLHNLNPFEVLSTTAQKMFHPSKKGPGEN
jgi:hypothetical protein